MKNPIFIYGAGGLGREILSLIHAIESWEPVGFIDDDFGNYSTVEGLAVFGSEKITAADVPVNVIIALGNPVQRQNVLERMNNAHISFPTLLHPSVILQNPETIKIGAGTVICAGCILTTNIVIGAHVLINLKNSIGHDTKVGDCSCLMPGVNVAGEVEIGRSVLIGSGSNLMNRIAIGDRCTIGMGSVVLYNVESGKTVAGVPAKEIQK
jgi:sugar O-acyltransferase (sialic acid O-acetyltransferase NeuD family)